MNRPLRYSRPSRADWILSQLQLAPVSARQCAITLGCPEPSVRREIQRLRRHRNVDIESPRNRGGLYLLRGWTV